MQLKIRKSKKITIREFSKKPQVPRRIIEDIERRGDCKVSTAIKFAKALNVTLDELCLPEVEN